MLSCVQSGAFRLAAQRACAVDFGVALRFVFFMSARFLWLYFQESVYWLGK